MKSHTGVLMTMGKGAIFWKSCKQKLMGKSSTEVEIIGVDNGINQVLWTKFFLSWQHHKIKYTTVLQDNKSSILLEKNGKFSSTKNTRHISIRYFFITDRVKNEDIQIEYCPTEDMIADFFTKPLQGSQFRKLRNLTLGISQEKLQQYNNDYIEYVKEEKRKIDELWSSKEK